MADSTPSRSSESQPSRESTSRSVSSGGAGGASVGDKGKSIYSASAALWPEFVRKMRPNWNSPSERRMLYSDPGKFEYYDDGSLRIIDDAIKVAVKEQAKNLMTAEERAEGSGSAIAKEGGGGDEMIDGRSC